MRAANLAAFVVNRSPMLSRCALLALFTAVFAGNGARADEVVAVYSRTFNGYSRQRLAGGGYRPETYTFVDGGRWDGSAAHRATQNLLFPKVVGVLAGAMRAQGFIPSFYPKDIAQIVFVYWGTTTGEDDDSAGTRQSLLGSIRFEATTPAGNGNAVVPNGAGGIGSDGSTDEMYALIGMMNHLRDNNDSRNAAILGYGDDLETARSEPWFAFSADTIDELEATRYYVVLKAFDFPLLLNQKKWKELWETRYSIAESGKHFGDLLGRMTASAAWAFGQDSRGLQRRPLKGTVMIGAPKVIEMPVVLGAGKDLPRRTVPASGLPGAAQGLNSNRSETASPP